MSTEGWTSNLKQLIEQRLRELRRECALQRLHLRNAHGPRWSGCPRQDPGNPSSWDLYWEGLQAEAQRERPKDVARADQRLAEFIAESRPFMGNDWPGTDHGRLCWSPFCGGMPIDQYYCSLEEGHSGPHVGTGTDTGREIAWPNSPLQEVTNDHSWHRLIKLCPHEAFTRRGSDNVSVCAVCGHPAK